MLNIVLPDRQTTSFIELSRGRHSATSGDQESMTLGRERTVGTLQPHGAVAVAQLKLSRQTMLVYECTALQVGVQPSLNPD